MFKLKSKVIVYILSFTTLLFIFGCNSGNSGNSGDFNVSNETIINDLNSSIKSLKHEIEVKNNLIQELNSSLNSSLNVCNENLQISNSNSLQLSDKLSACNDNVKSLENDLENNLDNTNYKDKYNIIKSELLTAMDYKNYAGLVVRYSNGYFAIKDDSFYIYNKQNNNFDFVFKFKDKEKIMKWSDGCGGIITQHLNVITNTVGLSNTLIRELKIIQNNEYYDLYLMWKNNEHYLIYDIINKVNFKSIGFNNYRFILDDL